MKARHLASALLLVFLSTLVIAYPACASNTVEEKVINALKNHSSYAFMISDDHIFTSGATGYTVTQDNNGSSTLAMTEKDAQGSLKNFSSGFVVRIDNGRESMGNSVDYTCDLRILSDNQGVSLSVSSINSKNTSESIMGIITGNTLAAHQEFSSTYYFVLTESGLGKSFTGDYLVSLVDVTQEQVAPQPVELDYKVNRKKRTINLTWTDPTPSGPADYYEVYRALGVTGDYEKVATVSDTSWTDKSKKIKSDLRNLVSYYVVSYNQDDVASQDSDHIIIAVSFWD